ncbi:MAG: FG-GAP repeat protein [Sandaracinaceae bacterium]|nr:FG-GAP repeat protein [Sandaracinaceae bacterium]
MNLRLALALTILLGGCTEQGNLLFVDLRSDYVSGAEFVLVESRLASLEGGSERLAMFGALRGMDFTEGARIADFTGLPPGRYRLNVVLRQLNGDVRVMRSVELRLGGNYAVTMIATRACENIECGDGQTCASGRCVDERCSPENPDACGTPACAAPTDCPTPTATCAEARCVSGECFAVERADSMCGPDAFCQPETSCVPYPDLPDAGPVDGGVDAGPVDGGAPTDLPEQIRPVRGAYFGHVSTAMAPPTAPSSGRPKFRWNFSPGADTFHLQVASDETFDTIVIDQPGLVEDSWIADRGSSDVLGDPGKYFWRVTGCNDAGCAPFGVPSYFWLGRVQEDIDLAYDGVGSILVAAPISGATEVGPGTLHRGEVIAFTYETSGRTFQLGGIATVDANGDTYTELGASIAVGHYDGTGDVALVAGGPARDGVGQVFAYSGGSALTPRASFPALQGGASSGSRFGEAVALFDVDGEGHDDLLVGQPGDGSSRGRVVIYWPNSSPTPIDETRSIALTSPNAPGDRFGSAIARLGDVNGDGYFDFAVGAPDARGEGSVYVYYGQARASFAGTLDGGRQRVDSPLPESGEEFGFAITGVGDVNQDGYDDALVGAPGSAVTRSHGSAYLFFGSAMGLNRGRGVEIVGDPAPVDDARFGAAVSGGGDIDGNGFPDFVVGAPEDGTGRVWLYRVVASDPFTVPPAIPILPSASDPGIQFGAALALTVDRSGDGHADLVVGAPLGINRGPSGMSLPTGFVDVFFGAPNADPEFETTLWGTGVGDAVHVSLFGQTVL